MTDLRVRYGIILAIALFPILMFSIYMAFVDGRVLLVVISILAWCFAYISLWASTDKLVFLHLRKIRIASDRFADGDLDARVGSMADAPARIAELGLAFDAMAESISERETKLIDNLQEKNTLLREIHHRVKNNLQIVISLLNMQERKLDDETSLTAIRETSARINAISLVHRGLYESQDLRNIHMPAFLSRLIGEIKAGLEVAEKGILVTAEMDPVKLSPDAAIPTALFIVEALTNAVKHGVSDGGNITIRLSSDNGQISVSVIDDGNGKGTSSVNRTGSKLMKGFARQLSGQWVVDPVDKGFSTSLKFSHDVAVAQA